MASLNITVPDDKVPRILAAFQSRFVQNPGEANQDFIKRCMIKFMHSVVIDVESRDTARTAASDKKDEIIADLGGIV